MSVWFACVCFSLNTSVAAVSRVLAEASNTQNFYSVFHWQGFSLPMQPCCISVVCRRHEAFKNRRAHSAF